MYLGFDCLLMILHNVMLLAKTSVTLGVLQGQRADAVTEQGSALPSS